MFGILTFLTTDLKFFNDVEEGSHCTLTWVRRNQKDSWSVINEDC